MPRPGLDRIKQRESTLEKTLAAKGEGMDPARRRLYKKKLRRAQRRRRELAAAAALAAKKSAAAAAPETAGA